MKISTSVIVLNAVLCLFDTAASNIEGSGTRNLQKIKKAKKVKILKKGMKDKSDDVEKSDDVDFFRPPPAGENECEGSDIGLPDVKCMINDIEMNDFPLSLGEQSGVNVTKGYNGLLDVISNPGALPFINGSYYEEGLCPVNVHWHLGTEHLSVGQYDESGSGPTDEGGHRNLAGVVRPGYQCHYYDASDPKFTTEYNWKHCIDTHVGETYEIHWPHSNAGACKSVNQFQSPFYDGVFCKFGKTVSLDELKVGVQGQVFTIVNDESYYYPNLMDGMIVDAEFGSDVAKYTGSTTGTKRDNEMCSQYTGITWQVDRKCHMISASSFDKLCADMKSQRDDMSSDLYPHGSRELVADHLAANNQQRN